MWRDLINRLNNSYVFDRSEKYVLSSIEACKHTMHKANSKRRLEMTIHQNTKHNLQCYVGQEDNTNSKAASHQQTTDIHADIKQVVNVLRQPI